MIIETLLEIPIKTSSIGFQFNQTTCIRTIPLKYREMGDEMANIEQSMSEETARKWLIERGVKLEDIAELIMYLH